GEPDQHDDAADEYDELGEGVGAQRQRHPGSRPFADEVRRGAAAGVRAADRAVLLGGRVGGQLDRGRHQRTPAVAPTAAADLGAGRLAAPLLRTSVPNMLAIALMFTKIM